MWLMPFLILILQHPLLLRWISDAYQPLTMEENVNDTPLIVVRNLKASIVIPEKPRMYLIHTGKAGASTVVRGLRLLYTPNTAKCMVSMTCVVGVIPCHAACIL
jgi:hypothetical protein